MKTDLEIYYTDSSETSKDWLETNRNEISDIVERVTISTTLSSASGKAELQIVGDGASFNFGSRIEIENGFRTIFVGYLFSVKMTDTDRFSATFYDQTRYLRNTDCYVADDVTASKMFRDLCEMSNIKVGRVDESKYKIFNNVYEGQSLWDMIQDAIEQTLAYENRLFIIRDNAGELEFIDIETLASDFVVDDEGVCSGFDYSAGIDNQTYNRVKLGYESESKGRVWGIAYNQEHIDKFGLLQYYQLYREKPKIDIEEMAEKRLALSLFPTSSVSLECFGDWNVSAGTGVMLNLSSIMAFNGMRGFYVSSCEHSVTCDKHTMRLTLATTNFSG